jgi:O-antigen/teichoic acid export membrane protein
VIKYLGSVSRATIGSVFAALIGQLILVISGIALARLLGPTDRGYLALLILWPTILFQLVGLGLPSSIAYHVANEAIAGRVVLRLLAIPFTIQSACLLLAHVLILLAYLHDKPAEVTSGGRVTLAIGPSLLVWDYGLAALQGVRSFIPLNLLRLLPSALIMAVAAGMLLAGNRSLVALASLVTLSYVIGGLITGYVAWRSTTSGNGIDTGQTVTRLMSFGLRGYIGSLYPLDSFRLDQVIVGVLLTPLSLGLYVAGSSFTNLPRFVAQGVGLVALPQIASSTTHDSRRSLLLRFFLFGSLFSLAGVLLLEATVGYLIPALFGNSFRASVGLAQILLIGAWCLGARRLLAEGLKGAGFPVAGTIAEVTSWVILALTLAFALRSGVVGMAWAVSLSFMFSFLVVSALAVRWDRSERKSARADVRL